MRLNIIKTKNAKSYYAIKSTYENGKHSSKVVEKLGTERNIMEKHGFTTPEECETWAKEYITELTKLEKREELKVTVKYSPTKLIEPNQQKLFNGGYLFLQKIYHALGLHSISKKIKSKYKFTFDLNAILACLIYGRILFPSSKSATHRLSQKFIQQPSFCLHHVYRSLEAIYNENDYIQEELYKNSLNIIERKTGVLYYDLTNYFFEIEEADEEEELRQYGKSKENRPNPIVQMGLFMDGSGLPLAFKIERGNKNEQTTLQPLEKKILKDFELSKFIVCTDAGLASQNNREFNSKGGRGFITTQSIKTLKSHIKDWALCPRGWKLAGKPENVYDISKLDKYNNEEHRETYKKLLGLTFYKERWINENGFEQRLIVTYSLKYRDYQNKIRSEQIARAQKTIKNNPAKLKKISQNDYRRFIKKTSVTSDGEVAKNDVFYIDQDVIAEESKYDGFYGVCTNLEDEVKDIIKINSGRWEIEESFRIMKSEFKARPVHLSRDDRITAHFTTCFIALLVYRILEKKLEDKYTCSEIIDCLKGLEFYKIQGEGYVPTYTRTDLTDSLHSSFGFRTDYEIVTNSQMRKAF